MDRGFLSNEEAVSLFKDYVDALTTGRLDLIEDMLEPSFYRRAEKDLREAHQEARDQNQSFAEQYSRRGHNTEFFLYNVENILLAGNISLDRTKNLDND